ncbi:MAG: hypothetical protein HN778_10695 [Prolixibacteraceae bacterium]|jgi:hypothetical protein|nr:hypothetical protein [Prolixibacteraceae bacterium]MBT6764757.1 hypothetical protein [Prolixibacteraceae bacterium]MBT6996828.1 hypothetical protein [Prolixibacteraceae bacterium]MBT7395289.1 hypothetical protein [Prolixibacteraceae bacterium]
MKIILKSFIAVFFFSAVIASTSCTGQSREKKESGESHESSERGEHSREKGGEGEGEEDGTQFSLSDKYDEVRNGARLILSFDKASNSFKGTVENTTEKELDRVRVEVHLSNGIELGPTTAKNLKSGEKMDVTLKGSEKEFKSWSAHAEVGNEEHGEGGEEGHGSEGEGEHGVKRKESGEHGGEKEGEHK